MEESPMSESPISLGRSPSYRSCSAQSDDAKPGVAKELLQIVVGQQLVIDGGCLSQPWAPKEYVKRVDKQGMERIFLPLRQSSDGLAALTIGYVCEKPASSTSSRARSLAACGDVFDNVQQARNEAMAKFAARAQAERKEAERRVDPMMALGLDASPKKKRRSMKQIKAEVPEYVDVEVPSVAEGVTPMSLTVLADDVRKCVFVECTAGNLMALAREFRRCIGRDHTGGNSADAMPRRTRRESPVKRVQFVPEKNQWKVRYTDKTGGAREKSFKVKAETSSCQFDEEKNDREREAIQFLQSNHHPKT